MLLTAIRLPIGPLASVRTKSGIKVYLCLGTDMAVHVSVREIIRITGVAPPREPLYSRENLQMM